MVSAVPASDDGKLTFYTGLLALGQYVIHLTVSKDDRTASDAMHIEVVSGSPPELIVR